MKFPPVVQKIKRKKKLRIEPTIISIAAVVSAPAAPIFANSGAGGLGPRVEPEP
jgi:hypothetical protein